VRPGVIGSAGAWEDCAYCISVNPGDVGLKLDPAEVEVEPGSGYYCFRAAILASNKRRSDRETQ
jgi:hypothetical protein